MTDQIKPISLQNARAKVHLSRFSEEPKLTVTVDGGEHGEFTAEFGPQSKEVREAMDMDDTMLQRIFDGGFYSFANGRLVEWRRAGYSGYVQSQEAIDHLSNALGASIAKSNNGAYSRGVAGLYDSVRTRNTNGVMFGGASDPFRFDVAELDDGGRFKANVVSKWSMYDPRIELSFDVERLVCTNGMVANSPFVTRAVPIVNDWETNLNIAQAQLQPHFTGIMQERLRAMADVNNRASVKAVQTAHRILEERSAYGAMTKAEQDSLHELLGFTDAKAILGSRYSDRVFADAKVAGTAPSHMTKFDLFNILTEANSSYGRSEGNDMAANRLVNALVFDDLRSRPLDTGTVSLSSDSDHRRAFFGK